MRHRITEQSNTLGRSTGYIYAKNRPILFTKSDGSVTVECTYDTMGRRATKKVTTNGTLTEHRRFLYRGYLQIACCDLTRAYTPALWFITWESLRGLGGGLDNARSGIAPKGRAGNGVPASQPTQPTATRPLAIQKNGTWYTYGWDLTKNICETYRTDGRIDLAYTYTPYGEVSPAHTNDQPLRWSSEYHDTELGLVYYNYRHYNPAMGRWMGRDIAAEIIQHNLYSFLSHKVNSDIDLLGLVSQGVIQMPGRCTECKEQLHIFIGGARDSVSAAMYRLYDAMRYDNASRAYYYWIVAGNELANEISSYKKLCPQSRIILLGHSYGGATAVDVAESVNGYNVILVTLDPVSDYDSFNYSTHKPRSVEYWINAYVAKAPHDYVSGVWAVGQLAAGLGTLIFGWSWSNAVASAGGKWGYESAADVNIKFSYYGKITHADAYYLFTSSDNSLRMSAFSVLDNYLNI